MHSLFVDLQSYLFVPTRLEILNVFALIKYCHMLASTFDIQNDIAGMM